MKTELAIMKTENICTWVKEAVKALPFTHRFLIHRQYREKVKGEMEFEKTNMQGDICSFPCRKDWVMLFC